MTYQQFVASITSQINADTPEDIHAEMHSSLKTNNITRLGITISDSKVNVSPTIYMEEFYEEYQNGLAISEIVSMVLDIYNEIRFDHSWKTDDLRQFQSIENYVVYKLLNKSQNSLLLMDVPYIPYHDLAIVFYIIYEMEDLGPGNILITNAMVSTWNITVDDLYLAASENTPRLLPAKFDTMYNVLCEMLGVQYPDPEFANNHMYVLTNSEKYFGAAAILYDGLLEKIAQELCDDFYLLPSSLHEFFILPRRYSPSTEHLDYVILDINDTQISPDEILANHSYYYSRLYKSLLLTH